MISVSTTVGGAATVVGGAATVVGGAATVVGGAPTVVGGAPTVVGGAATVVGGAATVVGGAPTVVGRAATVVGRAATVVGRAATVVGGAVTVLDARGRCLAPLVLGVSAFHLVADGGVAFFPEAAEICGGLNGTLGGAEEVDYHWDAACGHDGVLVDVVEMLQHHADAGGLLIVVSDFGGAAVLQWDAFWCVVI